MKILYPMQVGGGDAPKEIASLEEFIGKLNGEPGGTFLLGGNRIWHGGIHLSDKGGWHSGGAVRAIADGEIVAYRITSEPAAVRLEPEEGKPGEGITLRTSPSFCLIRHHYEATEEVSGQPQPKRNALTFYCLYMHIACKNAYQGEPDCHVLTGSGVSIYKATADLQFQGEDKLGTARKGAEITLIGAPSERMNPNNEPYSYQLVSYATPQGGDPSPFYVASQFIKEVRKVEPDWMMPKQDIPCLYPVSRNSYLRKSKEQGEVVAAGLPKMSKIARTTAQPVIFSNMKEYLEIEVWEITQGKLTDGTGRVVPNASKGERYWVAKEMLGQPSNVVRHTPILYDKVELRHTNPIPIKAGEVVGHWGEHETPKPTVNGFVLNEDRKAIHMEVFVAESDKEALSKCISNEGKLAKGQGYLLLKEGEQADTYKLTKENNKIGFSKVGVFGPLDAPKPINTQDIVTHGADKFVKVAEDQHVLISGDTRLVSQHEWARLGVTLVDGGSDPDGFLDKADTDGKEGGDFFSTLYEELVTDRDGDGSISADEIKAAMAEKMVADKVRKLFIKHESEWVKRNTWPRLEQELKNMPNLCKYVLEVTNKMAWIDKAAAVVGDTKPWFIHPAGMMGLVEPMVLTSNKCKKCRKDISLSFEFMRSFTPSSVSDSRLNDFIATWNHNAAKYGVNSCEQVINLLGQGKHETKRFTAFRESLVYRSYTAESLYAMAPTAINNGFARKGLSLSREEKMDYIRRHLLNNDSGYGEHSFGSNEFPGKDYRGRGLLHLTHAENYRLCALATGLNIYSNPELVETDMSSIVLSGFWFWSTNNLGLIADNNLGYVDKVKKVTKIINPGLKGLDERIEFTAEARELHVRLYGECN